MEDQIRSALASKDYALAQTLADDWLSQEPQLAVAHYFAAWSRDAQGLEADALIYYKKAFELGLSGKHLRGALLGTGSTYRNLKQLGRSEEILRQGVHAYGEVSEFSAFLALTLVFVGSSSVSSGRSIFGLLTLGSTCSYSREEVHAHKSPEIYWFLS